MKRLSLHLAGCSSALVVLLCVGASGHARAATLTVTSGADAGAGTLRQAIQDADADDTITFDLPLPATIALQSLLSLPRNLTIAGPGAADLTLAMQVESTVMQVEASARVTLSGLTITGGMDMHPNGGRGGAIHNLGEVALRDCAITHNTASGSVSGAGGAIFNARTLSVDNCAFADNEAPHSQGRGGAIYNADTAIIRRSSFRGHRAGFQGGAIYNSGTLSISDTTFEDNSAGADGGVLVNMGSATIQASTFDANSAGSRGGVIFAYSGTASFSDSTLVDNHASAGGALWNNATLTLAGSTAVGNWAGAGEVLYNVASATLSRSILIGTCEGPSVATSAGDNVRSIASCFDPSAALNDRIDLDPMLGPLQDNGGATWTRAPLPGSPVIDAVLVHDAQCGGTDQRGQARPVGARCDIGAVEYISIEVFGDGFE